MKPFALPLVVASLLFGYGIANGQGLLSIGHTGDFSENVPLTFDVRVSGGYDDIKYNSVLSGQPNLNSGFVEGGLGLSYADNALPFQWKVGADAGILHYTETEPGLNDIYYNTRLTFEAAYAVSRRLKISDNFYIAYEAEPDYGVGVSVGTFSGQYLYGYNNLNVAYAWSERFSTTTSYTIDGIDYTDNPSIADQENHLEHIFSQQFSYALSRTTALTAEYRFSMVRYSGGVLSAANTNPDYVSHYAMIGVDQAWSPRLTGSLRVGAQFYESNRENKVAPAAEASLAYKLSRKSNIRWYAQAGYDPTLLGDYASNYAVHTGVVGTYRLTESFALNAGIHYVYSQYDGFEDLSSFHENELDLSAGFTYNIWRNVSLDANYTYTTISSELDTQSYERNRVNVGLNATF